MFRINFALLFVTIIITSSSLAAEDYALVFAFKCGDKILENEAGQTNEKFTQFCIKIGTAKENILKFNVQDASGETLEATPNAILSACDELAAQLKENDTLRIIFTGYVSKKLLISASNGRLEADKLAASLNKIKAKREYYIFTSNSKALADALHESEILTVSGADSKYQAQTPRIAPFVMDALLKNHALITDGTKTLSEKYKTILAKAASELNDTISQTGIALSENPFFYADGKSSFYPFKENKSLPAASGVAGNPQVPMRNTPETLTNDELKSAYARYAKEAEKFPGSPVVSVRKESTLELSGDNGKAHGTSKRIYFIRKASAATELLRDKLTDSPRIQLLYPDGTLINLDNMLDTQTLPYLRDGTVLSIYDFGTIVNTQTDEFDRRIFIASKYPVCSGAIKILAPSDMDIKTLPVNIKGEFKKNASAAKKDRTEYTFDFSSIDGFISLPGDPNPELTAPSVIVTTRKDWDSLAVWIRRMMRSASEINDDDRKFIRNIIDNAVTEYENHMTANPDSTTLIENAPTVNYGKLKLIYNTVQSIRYMTVPLGAAAFRPQTVSEIRSRGYADCKDKANMLVRLAAEFGIKGYCVLANRFSDTNPQIPAWQFNHMLTYFPASENKYFQHDIWLDPTDGYTPFGALPPGDEGVTGMILTEKTDAPYEFKKIRSNILISNPPSLVLDLTSETPNAVFTFSGNAYTLYARELLESNDKEIFRFAERLIHDHLPGAEAVSASIDRKYMSLTVKLSKDTPERLEKIGLLPSEARDAFKYSERPNGLVINKGLAYNFSYRIAHKSPKNFTVMFDNAVLDGKAEIIKSTAKTSDGATLESGSLRINNTTMDKNEYKIIRSFLKQHCKFN